MTVYNDLSQAMEEYHDTAYTEVSFPMLNPYDTGKIGFPFANGGGRAWYHGFTNDGLTYLLYRLGTFVTDDVNRTIPQGRAAFRDLYREDQRDFVNQINRRRVRQLTVETRRKDRPLIVASHEGWIEGLLTHYNEVSHRTVVNKLGQSPIQNRLTGFRLSPKEMTLFFRSKYMIGNKVALGMAIRNGETGHVTLSYNVYVSSDDYTFFIPLNLKRRHLSKVGDVFDNLDKVMELAASIEVDQILLNTIGAEFWSLISDKKYDKIREVLSDYRSQPTDKMVSKLFDLRNERGYKTAATKALDAIFDKAFSMV